MGIGKFQSPLQYR